MDIKVARGGLIYKVYVHMKKVMIRIKYLKSCRAMILFYSMHGSVCVCERKSYIYVTSTA